METANYFSGSRIEQPCYYLHYIYSSVEFDHPTSKWRQLRPVGDKRQVHPMGVVWLSFGNQTRLCSRYLFLIHYINKRAKVTAISNYMTATATYVKNN